MFNKLSFRRADIWFLLVSLLMISFPWHERINAVFILLLAVFWLIDPKLPAKLNSIKDHWKFILPFWLFFLLHLAGLPATDHWPDAMHSIEVKLCFLVLPLLFSTENYLNEMNKATLFTLFCISCLLSALFCFIAYCICFYPLYQWSMVFNRIIFPYYIMHPGYYSNFFVIALIYLVLELSNGRDPLLKKKMSLFFFIPVFLLILFILVSKTAIIILILFSVTLIWKLLKGLRQKALRYGLFTGISLITLILFAAVPNIRNRITETKESFSGTTPGVSFGNSTGSRIAAWKLEWELIMAKWVTGYGTGDANALLQEKFIEGGYTDLAKYKMHTHNQMLHVWIDLGIAGVISLLIIFVVCKFHFYKTKNEPGIWSTLLLMLYCITDDALEIQSVTVFCIFLICVLLFQKKEQEAIAPQPVR